jgi:hypothetical protein
LEKHRYAARELHHKQICHPNLFDKAENKTLHKDMAKLRDKHEKRSTHTHTHKLKRDK